ncbi:hypothetical protein KY343_04185 [Candidatus Woesearchaeota archaeon]|nr:hypothetical protein [Candidatus Woesearchaeota archaeon]
MAFRTVEGSVKTIIKKTRGTTGLGRVIAELLLEEVERILEGAEHSEGSEKKGYLEQAIQNLETAYSKHPDRKIAAMLSDIYRNLGDVKRTHGMPGHEEDYARSHFYSRKADNGSQQVHHRGHNGYPHS